jgi:hypothetical protein
MESFVRNALDKEDISSVMENLKSSFHIEDLEHLKESLRDGAIFQAMYSTTPDGIFHGQMIKLRLEALKKEVPQPNEQGMVTLENGKQFQYQENMKLVNWIPFVNVFFDGVDSTPALEDLYNLLNLLLLVDALMISLAIGFPGIYGYDDLIEAVARFNGAAGDDDEYDINRYYHQWCMKTQNTNGDFPKDKCGWALIQAFTYQSTLSISMLGGAMLGCLVIYLCLCISDWDGPKDDSAYNMLREWWKPTQLGLYWCFFLSVAGIMYCFGAVRYVGMITYPGYYIDYYGKFKSEYDCGSDPNCAGEYGSTQVWFWCTFTFMICFAFCSIGLTLKQRVLCADITAAYKSSDPYKQNL